MSLKLQLNLALGLVLTLAIASMVGALLIDARPRLSNEIESSVRVAEEVVRASIKTLDSSPNPEEALASLVYGLRNQRHVSVLLAAKMPERGNIIPADRKPGTILNWVEPQEPIIRIPVVANGRNLGTILITGDGSDEMDEVWDTIARIALYGSMFAIVAFAITSWLIRSSLRPIDKLHDAISKLECGDYDIEIPAGGSPEIAGICAHIDTLATALGRARDENRRLSTAVVRIQDEERREIARELHDELGPHLFSLRASGSVLANLIEKGAADPERVKRDVQTMIDRTNVLQQTNRRVLQRLSPAGLEELGLTSSLEALAATWRQDQPQTTLTLEFNGPLKDIDPTTTLTIYRVIQEALTNAYRHARASHIAAEVHLRDRPRAMIEIRVRDNGDGFEGNLEPGFGLRGMRERVTALGGTLTILAMAEKGAELRADIPVSCHVST